MRDVADEQMEAWANAYSVEEDSLYREHLKAQSAIAAFNTDEEHGTRFLHNQIDNGNGEIVFRRSDAKVVAYIWMYPGKKDETKFNDSFYIRGIEGNVLAAFDMSDHPDDWRDCLTCLKSPIESYDWKSSILPYDSLFVRAIHRDQLLSQLFKEEVCTYPGIKMFNHNSPEFKQWMSNQLDGYRTLPHFPVEVAKGLPDAF